MRVWFALLKENTRFVRSWYDSICSKKWKPKIFKYWFGTLPAFHDKIYLPGPKSREISLMILHQIFQKSTEDPQVRGQAYRGCDLSKIPTRFLLKIFWRSQRYFLEILEWSSIKILLRPSAHLKKILNEDLHEIFFRNLIEISWRF